MQNKLFIIFVGMIFFGIITPTKSENSRFNGFYAGASIGYAHQITHLDAKQNPANPNAHTNNTTTQRGFPLTELFVGWGKEIGGGIYGGLEKKADWLPRRCAKIAEDTNFSYFGNRKNVGFAILGRLGYIISPSTLIYGGIGIKAVKYQYILFEKAGKIPATFTQKTLNPFSEIGMDTLIGNSKNLGLRISYSCMHNRSIIRKSNQFPTHHIYHEQGILKTSGTEHAFNVGLVYRF
ncbi:MAG: hypothetical protein FJX71_06565 [Alphaproteobacteria bacterium]|nr:hypothetical protein [Alphaproteobacteria bacterium]